MNEPDVKVVETGSSSDGQNKCPKCGGTCIALHVGAGALRCNTCRFEFEPVKAIGLDTDLSKLEGKVVGAGATNIAADAETLITLKCTSCGAEVMIDTNESAQARCHWCRNTLSINQQIPNGSIPDMLLPFSVTKENARNKIEQFVSKRQFFAHPVFKKEFCTENILGAYLPYMIVGMNTHADFKGQGEILVRTYTEGSGNNETRYYDADLYNVERSFDLVVEGLPIVSSSKKLDSSSDRTNNIINAIKPFDIENSVGWDPNYLRGFASEKRDTNIEDLESAVSVKTKDIARHRANETIKRYDRGVRWDKQDLDIKGQKWKAAYFPIWLYSYLQTKKSGKNKLHYVAVNARTEKTMGSVPINVPRLLLVSLIVQIIGMIIGSFLAFSLLYDTDLEWFGYILWAAGFAFYWFIYDRYRNKRARYKHEADTKTIVNNIVEHDNFVRQLTRLTNSTMDFANNTKVDYKM